MAPRTRTRLKRRKTSRTSRLRTRARNIVRSKKAKSTFSIGKKILPIATALAAPVSFVEQISTHWRQQLGTAYSQAPMAQKLKILSNIVVGSTTGMNPFKDEFQAPLAQLKIGNIWNKWSQAGIGMIGYSIIAKQANKALGSNILPAISPVKSIGKQLIIGGSLGGLLSNNPSTNNGNSGTANIQANTETAMQMAYTSGFQGNDSTLSGMT
tara:strand:- start:122 stop:754 length:633 start_codon:yes stop_codon:yes gene_type:complete